MTQRSQQGTRPENQTAKARGRKLLDVIARKWKLSVGDLSNTSEVGDCRMPDFKAAGLLMRGVARLADRRGRYAYAHHGETGGSLERRLVGG